jgi:6-phosphogluconolactonase
VTAYLAASGAGERDGGGVYALDPGSGAAQRLAPASGLMAIEVVRASAVVRIIGIADVDAHTVITIWERSGRGLEVVGRAEYPGRLPCAVAADLSGRIVAVADYGSNDVAVLSLDDDGVPALVETIPFSGTGPDPTRQDGFHPHHVEFDGEGRLVVTGLGADRVVRVAGIGGPALRTESVIVLPGGTGPRHLAHAGDIVAVSGELGGTVGLVRAPREPVTLRSTRLTGPAGTRSPRNYPGDVIGLDTAEGPVFYVANRGYDTIAVVRWDEDGPGIRQEIPASAWPIKLAIADHALAVACTDADRVEFFALDPATGRLDPAATARIPLPEPVWVVA